MNLHFFNSHSVERGSPVYSRRLRNFKPSFRWYDGWAQAIMTGTVYPILTRREALTQARSECGRAVFHDTEEAARAAVLSESLQPVEA